MNVLIVNPSFWIYGGAERVIVKLCNYLTEHGIKTTILTTKIIDEIKNELTDTRLLEVENYENLIETLHAISNDFDVINIHNDPCQLMVYPKKMNAIWSFNELPQSIQLGGKLPDIEREIVRKFIKRIIVADISNSEKVLQVYDKESKIIPYGIDYEFFNEFDKQEVINVRERYGINDNDFIITQVAFIAPTKNQLETIKVFAEVKKEIKNAKLILVGYDKLDYKKQVEEEIFKNNLYGDVIFTGKLDRKDVRAILHLSDVTIQPNKGQGSWLSVFESICAGCPSLVSKEFTGQEEVGALSQVIPCREKDTYVANIINIYNNMMDPTGEGIEFDQEWIKENLNWNNYCELILEVFNESLLD